VSPVTTREQHLARVIHIMVEISKQAVASISQKRCDWHDFMAAMQFEIIVPMSVAQAKST
jgi:hypothetical protein